MQRWALLGFALFMLILPQICLPPVTRADQGCDPWVSRIVSLQGQVAAKSRDGNQWRTVRLNDTFCPGDTIHVALHSRAAFTLSNESLLRVDQNTTVVFSGIEKPKTFLIQLLEGAAHFFSRKARSLKVVTPFVNGVVEGTEFLVQVDADKALLALFEGHLRAENDQGTLLLTRSQTALAKAAQPPRLYLMAHPRDAVQWALYYPPVLAMQPAQLPASGPQDWPAKVRHSMEALGRQDISQAFAAIQGIGDTVDDPRFRVYRAALLMTVGQIAEAREDLRRALARDSENSNALALRAIIGLVQNQRTAAFQDAQQAVRSDPRSAAAHIALSYVLQADFKLTAALQEVRAAAQADPQNGLAWSRMAELHLSLGNLDAALTNARTAVQQDPGATRAQTVLGFAFLTQIKIEHARQAFRHAIMLDSAAPLPRLGLGLAEIRDGHLSKGRAEMEIAAGLDPGNALIRSYLGKAYFDEKREPLDERQFEIAKSLDPNDPTPWFYDAIRKQTLNRPGEALQDMQKSIALNDQRAVYRSRLLLDEDLAARSASLGRIYNDLSFQEQALRQGWHSVEADPSNFSAHRLLADLYASRSRYEIARVSELLQSQLLQPLNLTPVQPSLAQSDLLVLEGSGPSDLAFNEFNPLFVRDRLTLQASGVAGDQNTLGEEMTVAGVWRALSFSTGQYHYETDGFRENNDLKRDIYDIFTQARISPHQSLQVEYRDSSQKNGDLRLHFDPEDFSDNLREERKEHIPRIGYHYSSNNNHHFIASLTLNRTEFQRQQQSVAGSTPFGPIVVDEDRDEGGKGYNLEGQYIISRKRSSFILGLGQYEQNSKSLTAVSITSGPLVLLEDPGNWSESDTYHNNAYFYANMLLLRSLTATIGLSFDNYDSENVEMHQYNPKIGFTWRPANDLTLRAAAFRVLKRSLIADQTIEPTQVAGFNQFFDDATATDAKRYGLGVDYQLARNLVTGAEYTWRDLEVPVEDVVSGSVEYQAQDDMLHRFYIDWLPDPRLALSCEYQFEEFSRDDQNKILNQPYVLQTQTIPLTVAYFDPGGLFAKFRAKYVLQKIEQFVAAGPSTTKVEDGDDFYLVDAEIGYRMPNRSGILSLAVTNFFDAKFNYYDADFRTGLARIPTLRPERQVLIKAKFSF